MERRRSADNDAPIDVGPLGAHICRSQQMWDIDEWAWKVVLRREVINLAPQ